MKTEEKKTLGDYCKIMSGIGLGKVVSSNNSDSDSIILLKQQDMHQNGILDESVFNKLQAIEVDDELRRIILEHHYLQENDIIITSRGSLYNAVMIQDIGNRNIIINNNCMLIRPSISKPHFIIGFITSRWFIDQFIQKDYPANLKITTKYLKNLPIPLIDESAREEYASLYKQHLIQKHALESLTSASQDMLDAQLFYILKDKSREKS
ncbi:hypothetical protein [Thiomicrospira microaerophila]|uniref:hypothetical protein n=1 Tax=Thiomicrospira microaerophila TaxID=406020 RepID=UPI0005C8AC77|nr:hypothetical protein [Thiomicrospira microaerophila]